MKVFAAPFLSAPMAGVTDVAFRARLTRNGCRALWTEMICATALVRGHKLTRRLIDPPDRDEDLTPQLFGAKPPELAQAARMLADVGWRRVDFNMGCPVRKVAKTGSGAALLSNPENARACIGAIRDAFQGCFTVKLRLGLDQSHRTFLDIARLAQALGVDGIILHGRTRRQGYSGVADWDAVRELRQAVTVPVAGNGDVADGPDALRRLAQSGADAVMIGRAALSRPWLFRDAHRLWEGLEPLPPPGPKELSEDVLLQFEDLLADKGERCAVPEMKKFAAWAARGFHMAAEYRRGVMAAHDTQAMREAIGRLAELEPGKSAPETDDFCHFERERLDGGGRG